MADTKNMPVVLPLGPRFCRWSFIAERRPLPTARNALSEFPSFHAAGTAADASDEPSPDGDDACRKRRGGGGRKKVERGTDVNELSAQHVDCHDCRS